MDDNHHLVDGRSRITRGILQLLQVIPGSAFSGTLISYSKRGVLVEPWISVSLGVPGAETIFLWPIFPIAFGDFSLWFNLVDKYGRRGIVHLVAYRSRIASDLIYLAG